MDQPTNGLADQFEDFCQIDDAVQVDVVFGAKEALWPPRGAIGAYVWPCDGFFYRIRTGPKARYLAAEP